MRGVETDAHRSRRLLGLYRAGWTAIRSASKLVSRPDGLLSPVVKCVDAKPEYKLPTIYMTHTKSKQRVADHGEVFTPDWMVEAMLDLVKGETERTDSRFLEPAC